MLCGLGVIEIMTTMQVFYVNTNVTSHGRISSTRGLLVFAL